MNPRLAATLVDNDYDLATNTEPPKMGNHRDVVRWQNRPQWSTNASRPAP